MEITKAATSWSLQLLNTLEQKKKKKKTGVLLRNIVFALENGQSSHFKMDRVGGHTLSNFKTYGKVKC